VVTIPVDRVHTGVTDQVLLVLLQLGEGQLGGVEGLRRTLFTGQHSNRQLQRSLRGDYYALLEKYFVAALQNGYLVASFPYFD